MPEIDITPAMIEAGLRALFPNETLPWFDDEEVVAAVYRAMEAARRAPTRTSSGAPVARRHPLSGAAGKSRLPHCAQREFD
jgi:hypothetical protein